VRARLGVLGKAHRHHVSAEGDDERRKAPWPEAELRRLRSVLAAVEGYGVHGRRLT
jgi:hypothetical protein